MLYHPQLHVHTQQQRKHRRRDRPSVRGAPSAVASVRAALAHHALSSMLTVCTTALSSLVLKAENAGLLALLPFTRCLLQRLVLLRCLPRLPQPPQQLQPTTRPCQLVNAVLSANARSGVFLGMFPAMSTSMICHIIALSTLVPQVAFAISGKRSRTMLCLGHRTASATAQF